MAHQPKCPLFCARFGHVEIFFARPTALDSIPRAIAPEQTKKLLASIDRKTAVGRRDYAIVLLLARLGLRAGEVAAVELNDIDWGAGQLIVHGKGGRRSEMPLPPEVGKAIAAYLRHGRPRCASRRVFLRTRAPIRGFEEREAMRRFEHRWGRPS